ncbi:adhesive plaque matrix protein-like [Cydia strobilella]|uniref:adhesive plaque matrix protein-like n=1 Tax=Cydia strobilella TaxID=1100964 RepID=UPI00300438A6
MKLLLAFLAILAISYADEEGPASLIEDSEAVASVELLKTEADTNAASNYVPPSQRPPRGWNAPQISQQNNWTPPANNYWNQNQNPVGQWPSPDAWKPDGSAWNQNQWTTQPTWTAAPSWSPPSYVPGWQNPSKPPVQHDQPTNLWTVPQQSATPVEVIKNDQYYGDNGSYKYEYQISDGTHVGEEGYLTNPNTDNESLVKKGWYSFVGADGKTYTVTWWADSSGFHASGDHLPTAPPVPAAIQAANDQAAKEEAAKLEAEKNKPQQTYPQQTYPQQTYPQQTYPQQTYPQQTYPQQTYPQQTYPQQTYPQQTYPQQTYPQQTYPQQTYPQQTYPQQTYPQQTYPQQTNPQQTEGSYYPQHNKPTYG